MLKGFLINAVVSVGCVFLIANTVFARYGVIIGYRIRKAGCGHGGLHGAALIRKPGATVISGHSACSWLLLPSAGVGSPSNSPVSCWRNSAPGLRRAWQCRPGARDDVLGRIGNAAVQQPTADDPHHGDRVQ